MFNVGDEIVIITNDGYCPYSFTTPGSKGVVEEIIEGGREVYVDFHFFASGYGASRDTFRIEPQYMKLIQSIVLNAHDAKYPKIITKIKRMEAKRKELGYKTYGTL